MVSCALIGYGYWGQILSCKLSEANGFSLKYICDLNDENLLQQGPKSNFKSQPAFIQDAQKIFRDPLIEVIFIATPPNTHYQLTHQALLNEKHVWLEKPGTTSLKEYSDLADLAERKNRLLYVDFIVLFEPWLKDFKSRFRSDLKQSVKVFTLRESIRIEQGSKSNLKSDTLEPLYDLAVHDLSVLKSILPLLEAESLSIDYSIYSDPSKSHPDKVQETHLPLASNSRYALSLHSQSFQAKIVINQNSDYKSRYFQIGSHCYYFSNDDGNWYYAEQEPQAEYTAEFPLSKSKVTALEVESESHSKYKGHDSLTLALQSFYDAMKGNKALKKNVEIAKFVHQVFEKCKRNSSVK